MCELVSALKSLKDTLLIFTMPNADKESRKLFEVIENFSMVESNVKLYKSLGHLKYLSCLNQVDAVIGNSSSGILEVPTFKIPTINIGNRQDGRVMASSVINVDYKKKNISKSIDKIYSKKFKKLVKISKNPYGNGGATDNMIKILLKIKQFTVKKTFKDLKFK